MRLLKQTEYSEYLAHGMSCLLAHSHDACCGMVTFVFQKALLPQFIQRQVDMISHTVTDLLDITQLVPLPWHPSVSLGASSPCPCGSQVLTESTVKNGRHA